MMDIVNEYFRKFYPADWQTADYNYSSMLGGMRRYDGESKVSNVFPQMKCSDGLTMSVQGHAGSYSYPRYDFADEYRQVEVGFPNQRVEELMPYIDGGPDSDPTQSVYGFVPVEVIVGIIEKHGGLTS